MGDFSPCKRASSRLSHTEWYVDSQRRSLQNTPLFVHSHASHPANGIQLAYGPVQKSRSYTKCTNMTSNVLLSTSLYITGTSGYKRGHSVCYSYYYRRNIMLRKKAFQFVFRTDEKNAAAIRKKIAESGQSQQDYLTLAALHATIINPACFRELLTEYKRQGNNLNQIAHAINVNGQMDPTTAQLIENMNQERKQIWQLLSQCTQTLASVRP